jgi:hypothetical protein
MEFKDSERKSYVKKTSIMQKVFAVLGAVCAFAVVIVAFNYISDDIDIRYNALPKSTKVREPLKVDPDKLSMVKAHRISVLENNKSDTLYWYDSRDFEEGVATFYEKTGVLMFLEIENSHEFIKQDVMEDTYRKVFNDSELSGPNILIVIAENIATGEFKDTNYVVGKQALSLMDHEAVSILVSAIERAYLWYDYKADFNNEYVLAFDYAADRILIKTGPRPSLPFQIIFIIVVVGVIVGWLVVRRRFKKYDEIHSILNTDLNDLSNVRSKIDTD